jgi:hypothetical protein
MSRTYRSNPRVKQTEYEYGEAGLIYYWWKNSNIVIPRTGRISKGGWKEAKRVLHKEEYARQRSLRGDKFTGYFENGGVPWWYRHEMEKQHRWETKRQLHLFMRDSEHEPMVHEEPSGVEYYYWY